MVTHTMAETPSGWSTVHDLTKTVITIASGLLVVTVTFAEKILTKADSGSASWLIFIWIMLIVSILLSLISAGTLSNFLNDLHDNNGEDSQKIVKKQNKCILMANVGLGFLFLASVGFLGLGWQSISARQQLRPSIQSQLNRVLDQRDSTGDSRWRIAGSWQAFSDTMDLLLMKQADTLYVRVDARVDTLLRR